MGSPLEQNKGLMIFMLLSAPIQTAKEIPGLQCVDFLAWVSLNLALDNFNQKPMHLFADDALKDLERNPEGKTRRYPECYATARW